MKKTYVPCVNQKFQLFNLHKLPASKSKTKESASKYKPENMQYLITQSLNHDNSQFKS